MMDFSQEISEFAQYLDAVVRQIREDHEDARLTRLHEVWDTSNALEAKEEEPE